MRGFKTCLLFCIIYAFVVGGLWLVSLDHFWAGLIFGLIGGRITEEAFIK